MSHHIILFSEENQTLFNALFSSLESLGVEYLSFSRRVGEDEFYYASQAPWQESRRGRGDNPLHNFFAAKGNSYLMWEAFAETQEQGWTLAEEKEACGLVEVLSLFDKGEEGTLILTLGTQQAKASFYTGLLEKAGALKEIMRWMGQACQACQASQVEKVEQAEQVLLSASDRQRKSA